jgi:hypothetical protein
LNHFYETNTSIADLDSLLIKLGPSLTKINEIYGKDGFGILEEGKTPGRRLIRLLYKSMRDNSSPEDVTRYARCANGCTLVECSAFENGAVLESLKEAQLKLTENNWTCWLCGGTRIKTFEWLSIAGTIKKLYNDPVTAKLMHYRHETGQEVNINNNNNISDVYFSEKYKLIHEQIQKSPNPDLDVVLGISWDGVDAAGRSMWPCLTVNYNLSPFVRSHMENINFHGLFRLVKGSDIESHLLPFVLEALHLGSKGVEVFDAHTNKWGMTYS